MITFKQYLMENPNYPLYHGTTIENLVNIIKSDVIFTSDFPDARHENSQLAGKHTVSLTRNLKFAEYWAKRIEWYRGDTGRLVIRLNRSKLKTRYKIVPYNHFMRATRQSDSDKFSEYGVTKKKEHEFLNMNQYEERIIGNVNDAEKYIEEIIIDRKNKALLKKEYPFIYETLIVKGWMK